MTVALLSQAQNVREEVYTSDPTVVNTSGTTTLDFEEPLYNDLQNGLTAFGPNEIENLVTIRFTYDDPALMVEGMSATVDLAISYTKVNSDRSLSTGTENTTLVINYTEQGVSNDKATFEFVGGNQLSITATPNGTIPANVEMQATIAPQRLFALSNDPITLDLNDQALTTDGNVVVSWTEVPGAIWYDLEWAFVNDYEDVNGEFLEASEITVPQNLFRNNSTRVSKLTDNHAIPMIYEHGYLVYRVRAVGRDVADLSKYTQGSWTDSDHTNLIQYANTYFFQGHESDKNWQYISNFAEDGKSKVAVSYFDGSLRNRQSVSKLNTENEAIVGETVYDHQGRGAIQILPVPTDDPQVKFYERFNQDDTLRPYNWNDFDLDVNESCITDVGELNTVSGASNYYSSQNPDTDIHHQYLPDAEGYPFTQIEYTPDNTGRIRRQGGVGETHQLGNGHETKYFYSKPDQKELDRLFGSEVGLAKHYKKNVVIDANGQASVSLLDPQGRVIATFLEGAVPENLIGLEPIDVVNYEVDLLEKNPLNELDNNNETTKTVRGGSLDLHVERTLTNTGDYTVNYNANIGPYNEVCNAALTNGQSVQVNFCKDCVLKLEITIIDGCAKPVDGATGTLTSSNPDNCTGSNITVNDEIIIPIDNSNDLGTYTIDKKLVIDEAVLDGYVKEYLTQNCHLTFDDFRTSAYQTIDTINCSLGCDECLIALEDEFGNTPPQIGDVRYQEYIDRKAVCDDVCGPIPVTCQSAYIAMLQDVSPHGQYGLLRKEQIGQVANSGEIEDLGNEEINLPDFDNGLENDELDPSLYPLSIFNTNNSLSRYVNNGNNYTLLQNMNYTNPVGLYEEADGTPSRIRIREVPQRDEQGQQLFNEDGTIMVVKEPAVGDVNDIKTDEQGEFVYPQELANIEDFISNWKPSWAKALVFYHPEYPLYEDCLERRLSHEFREDIIRTTTVQSALNKGYVGTNEMGYLNLVDEIDPFFNSSTIGNLEVPFKSKVTNSMVSYVDFGLVDPALTDGYTMWEVAHSFVNCPFNDPAVINCADPSCPGTNGVDSDEAWQAYKPLYLSLRDNAENAFQRELAAKSGYSNECIGAEGFDPIQSGLLDNLDNTFGNTFAGNIISRWFFNRFSICGSRRYQLYADKQPRFLVTRAQGTPNTLASQEFCVSDPYFESDNACPEQTAYVGQLDKLRYDIKIAESCGQCPITNELENFLADIVDNENINFATDPIPLGCYSRTEVTGFSDILLLGMGFSDGLIDWENVTVDNTSDDFMTIQADLQTNSGSQNCDVFLKLAKKDADGVSVETLEMPFDLDEIDHLCCLRHLQPTEATLLTSADLSSLGASDQTSNLFSFGIPYTENQVELKGEGYTSCLSISTCDIAPLCEVNRLGIDLTTLFTMMSRSISTTTHVLTQGYQSTPNVLNFDQANAPYTELITPAMEEAGIDETWKWTITSFIAGTSLSGTLSNSDNTESYPITFEVIDGFPTGTDFTSINRFSALRADYTEGADPTTDFIINAIVETGTTPAFESVKLSISFGTLPIIDCTEAITISN